MTTTKVGNRRLLVLADFLEKLPPKRFDMGNWVGHDWQGAADLSCGTTACMLGWATTIHQFRRLGLRLRRGAGTNGGYITLTNTTRRADSSAVEVSNEIFALDYSEHARLFYAHDTPNTVITPKQGAELIRRFVAAREAK